MTSSLLAPNSPEFESQLWPSVIPGQWSSPLGLGFPSPKQTGYSGRQVPGLLGEQLLSWESSLIHGCVWWNPSWVMTPGVGQRPALGSSLPVYCHPEATQPGYSLPSMPCCCWLLRGYGCRGNLLILFPLAAEHSASRRAWPEAGTVSRHLDSLPWPWQQGLAERLAAGWLQALAMAWSFSPVAAPESTSELPWPLGASLDSQQVRVEQRG